MKNKNVGYRLQDLFSFKHFIEFYLNTDYRNVIEYLDAFMDEEILFVAGTDTYSLKTCEDYGECMLLQPATITSRTGSVKCRTFFDEFLLYCDKVVDKFNFDYDSFVLNHMISGFVFKNQKMNQEFSKHFRNIC